MKIFFCPALMDALVFLVMFAVMYRAGAQGLSITQCAWLASLFQLTYMFASLAVGFLLTRRNTRAILLASTVLCTLCGVACLLAEKFTPVLAAFGCIGIFMAFFFNAFQGFLRTEAVPGDLKRAIGLYTMAWSLGSAAGILSSGFFYRLGFTVLSALILLGGGAILAVLLMHKPRPANAPSADENVEGGSAKAPPVDPIYVWIGWLTIFMAMFVQRPIHSFFPAISAKAGVSAFVTGLPLFLQMALQAVVGLAMIRWRHLLYRRTPLALVHGGAAALLLAMWRWPALPVCFLGIGLLGAYAGFVYFCSVYYASNSGRRSLNIGVNEFLVGLGSVAGLLISEWVMKRTASDANLYLVIAVALLITLAAQLAIAGGGSRRHDARERQFWG
ncbi:MAG: MFS transporter [Kiritimatiellia bacterium]|jgi:predicted MFS family arabinose efflux permease